MFQAVRRIDEKRNSRMENGRFRSFGTILAFMITISAIILLTNVTVQAAGASSYRLGPGDVLEISVWQDESLKRQIVVLPDRTISYPLVGEIDVNNKTVGDIRTILTQKLRPYVPDATVTVLLMQINSLTAYVIGKVNNPGQFPINMETTVVQLLAMAGGLNPFAKSGDILILRKKGSVTQKLAFDYDEVKNGRNLDQNVILQPGDVVIVP